MPALSVDMSSKNTVGRPHSASVVGISVPSHLASSPIGSLASRSTQSQLASWASSQKKRRAKFLACAAVTAAVLLALILCVALLYPRPPAVSVPPASTVATATVAPDGSFKFELRSIVRIDNSASFVPWAVRGVVLTLQGAKASAPVFSLPHVGDPLLAAARAQSVFSVRASVSSAQLPTLVPALTLISTLASGQPAPVFIKVDFTPVYLGVALPQQTHTTTVLLGRG